MTPEPTLPDSPPAYGDIVRDALWRNNAGIVQLLGLCPLLAVSATVVNGLGLGLATLAVVTVSNLAVSLVRRALRPEIRIAVFVIIIASLVTAVEMILQAWFFDLHQRLGIFIPLIVTNCAIVGRAEIFASRNGPLRSLVDGLATGAGFMTALVALGSMRELVGHGTLFRDAHLLFGDSAREWHFSIPGYDGFLLALLPPGAFIALALIVAAKNALGLRHGQSMATPALPATPGPVV